MKKFSAPSIWNPNSALVRCSKEISEKLFLLILYLRHSHYREEFKSAVQKFASSNTAQMLVACLPSSWTQAANQHHNITKNRKLFYSQKEAFSPTLPEKNFPGSPVKNFLWSLVADPLKILNFLWDYFIRLYLGMKISLQNLSGDIRSSKTDFKLFLSNF